MDMFQSFTETAGLVSGRRVSCSEVAETILGRISEVNEALNAIVTMDKNDVMMQAEELDGMLSSGRLKGPLHGIPVTIKDNIEVKGVRTTAGHQPLSGNIPTTDATVVERLRNAGAVIIGKTNMPELAMGFQTDNPIFGRTNNPWDISRTPGGSTGGGAAAVASGMSYLEIGNDLLGSVRIPANYCGVYGFVPTACTIPKTGFIPESPSGGVFSHFLRMGILARSIDDVITAFSTIKGPDDIDMDTVPFDFGNDGSTCGEASIKIAWVDDAGGVPASLEVKEILSNFLVKARGKGYSVERVDSGGLGFAKAKDIFYRVFLSLIGTGMPRASCLMARIIGRNNYFDLDLKKYFEAETARARIIRDLDSLLSKYDVLVCPVTSIPAFTHCKPVKYVGSMPVFGKLWVDGSLVDYGDANSAFTVLFSISGNPVIVVPAGKTKDGLPVGLQIVGKRWGDDRLLKLARQLTDCMEPVSRPPVA